MKSKYNIYVASSWKNKDRQQHVVNVLREAGHYVYDFINPGSGTSYVDGDYQLVEGKGFSWADIDPNWRNWTVEEYTQALTTEYAKQGFYRDKDALENCDICVLVMPCGRCAGWELGFATGRRKATAVIWADGEEADLMFWMSPIYKSVEELIADMNPASSKTNWMVGAVPETT